MKKRSLLPALCLLLVLGGCSFGDVVMDASGIREDPDYQLYEELREAGELDDTGAYRPEAIFGPEGAGGDHAGEVRVTFADNPYLSIQYFRDPGHTQPIEGNGCYLKPGEALYASRPESVHPKTGYYDFSAFRVCEHRDSGTTWTQNPWGGKEGGFVLRVPADFTGDGLSVEPLGQYQSRTLVLDDHYFGPDGKKHALDEAGTWVVNGGTYAGGQVEVSPLGGSEVRYVYDRDRYFFLSAKPASFRHDGERGTVIFNPAQAGSEPERYSVELHPYLDLEVTADADCTAIVNGRGIVLREGRPGTLDHLAFGDQIVLETASAHLRVESGGILEESAVQRVSRGYRYTYTVTEGERDFCFEPEDYIYEHGEILFRCEGEALTEARYLKKGTKITYEPVRTDEGYWLPGGENTIVVSGPSETSAALSDLRFYPHEEVTVLLPRPQVGGRVHYFFDGEELTGDSVKLYCGSLLEIRLDPWEGWKSASGESAGYRVQEAARQSVQVDGVRPDQVFSEEPSHKPAVRLILDSSVGYDLRFGITAAGVREDGLGYHSAGLGGMFADSITVLEELVGSHEDVCLSVSGAALPGGTALKLHISRKDMQGRGIEEVRYLDRLPVQEHIAIYAPDELEKPPVTYRSINITVSVVEPQSFEAPQAVEHGALDLRFADTLLPVKAGERLDDDRELTLTLIPAEGYYLGGPGVGADGAFHDTLTYREYQRELERILRDHPICKSIRVTLETQDAYGTCTYYLDGRKVSGTLDLRSGDVLELEYRIVNEDYRIQFTGGGLLDFFRDKTRTTVDIHVDEDLDGQTLRRADYVTVVRKGR